MLGILALSLFVAIVMAGALVAGWARTREEADQTLERRLDLAAGGSAREREAVPVLKDRRLSTIKAVNTLLAQVRLVPKLERAIKQSGLGRRPGEILLYVPLLGCVGFLGGLLVSGKLLVGLVLGTLLGFIPITYVYRRKRRRAAAFA